MTVEGIDLILKWHVKIDEPNLDLGIGISFAPAPGHDEVILPGEREFRTLASRQRQGIPLSREACRLIDEVAEKVGVHAGL